MFDVTYCCKRSIWFDYWKSVCIFWCWPEYGFWTVSNYLPLYILGYFRYWGIFQLEISCLKAKINGSKKLKQRVFTPIFFISKECLQHQWAGLGRLSTFTTILFTLFAAKYFLYSRSFRFVQYIFSPQICTKVPKIKIRCKIIPN